MIRRFRNRRLNESIRRNMNEAVSYGRFEPSDLKSIKRDIDKLKALYDNSEYIIEDGNVDDLKYTIDTFMKWGEVEDGDDSVYDSDESFVGVLQYAIDQLRKRCEKTLMLCDSIESKID